MRKILPILIFCLLVLNAGAQSKRVPSMSSDDPMPTAYDASGYIGVLTRKGDLSAPVANTVEVYRLYAKYVMAQRKDAIQELLDADELLAAKPGTEVRVLGQEQMAIEGKDVNLIRVRVLAGAQAGREGWTNRDFFSPRGDSDAPFDDTVNGINKAIALGNRVKIVSASGDESLYLFVNEQAFKNAYAQGQRRNAFISQMLATGGVFQVPVGTAGVVADIKNILINGRFWAVALIRIDEGRFAGKAGWVYQQEVKKLD